jgi:hypothetical protein
MAGGMAQVEEGIMDSSWAPLIMVGGLLAWGFAFSAGSYILDAWRERRKDQR